MNILVNEKKVKRAKDILDLLGRAPKTDEEKRLKETFSELITKEKVDKKDHLEFIYSKLGGLVRTEKEQKEADEVSKKAKAKMKNKKNKDDEETDS